MELAIIASAVLNALVMVAVFQTANNTARTTEALYRIEKLLSDQYAS